MISKTEDTSTAVAYKKKLPNPINYSIVWSEYENYAEVVAAGKLLTEEEVVSFRNTQSKAKARTAALTAALDAAGIVAPTLENDEQLRLRKMYDIYRANGKSHDVARAKAAQELELEWAE